MWRPEGGAITLHGDGRGRVLIAGAWDGPRAPFSVTGALRKIADSGVFESGVDFKSAAWGTGDVAALVEPYMQDAEYMIDGVMWWGADPESPYDIEDIVLAGSAWELTGGGGVMLPRAEVIRGSWSCCVSALVTSCTSAAVARRYAMLGTRPTTKPPWRSS